MNFNEFQWISMNIQLSIFFIFPRELSVPLIYEAIMELFDSWLYEGKFVHDFASSKTEKYCSEWVSLEEKSISSGGL